MGIKQKYMISNGGKYMHVQTFTVLACHILFMHKMKPSLPRKMDSTAS